jgi:hypothetical protein
MRSPSGICAPSSYYRAAAAICNAAEPEVVGQFELSTPAAPQPIVFGTEFAPWLW